MSERQKEVYNAFIRNTPTKFGAIKAAAQDYAKIVMLDVDMIMVDNCDALFDLKAPAACWGYPRSSKNLAITPAIDRLNLKTGDKISVRDMERTLRSGSFCCWGSVMLCEATEKAFNEIMLNIGTDFSQCHSGPEEQMFAMYCISKGPGTNIGQGYNRIPWKSYVNDPGKPKIIHYHSSKPWAVARDAWADLALWWKEHDELQKNATN
ncbi:unnamed protein product [Sphagnum jensenii]|uniref:Hexosyltransferase n=1 Tax=Sphagnum jensenii TaxID=128206 RepID=A0ABP0VA13_9BRYO